uniref:Uncharacterized protein n=3 Tax=Fagus sylvatica TaxID=28930 RepID=A0A2N9J535_FAGSY
MASSSSQNKPETINLNDTPSVMPEVWRPYFLSINGPVSVTDSVILNGETATAVAAGLCTPEDAKVLAGRTDPQIINESLALTIQCTATVSNMGRRLHVRNMEVKSAAFSSHHFTKVAEGEHLSRITPGEGSQWSMTRGKLRRGHVGLAISPIGSGLTVVSNSR